MEAHEVHNLVQYRVSEDWRRRGEKKENAFKFMLKCMFYKRTERDLQRREIANWSRIERRAAPYASSFSIDKWLKTPGDGMRWWLELLVNKFFRNSLANYKIHHQHIRARWTHKRMQIIYFIWEQRGGEKKNNYENYHNNFELSVCGWTAGNTIAWHFMHFFMVALFSHMIFIIILRLLVMKNTSWCSPTTLAGSSLHNDIRLKLLFQPLLIPQRSKFYLSPTIIHNMLFKFINIWD